VRAQKKGEREEWGMNREFCFWLEEKYQEVGFRGGR
jgi:hypothetical protein